MNLDVTIIRAGKAGDNEALSMILSTYEAYINQFCYVAKVDEYGCLRQYLDEDIKSKIQSKLILAIRAFDLEGSLQKSV